MIRSRLKLIFWVALAVKLVLSALLPLTNDEAYYWVWSQHLQLSYYDHPPAVAWLLWLGQFTDWFPGSVRWPGVLLGQGTLALWLLLLRPFLTVEQLTYWLLLALLSPLAGGSNLVVTPDLPLMFFYALSLYIFQRWREEKHWGLALALGLSLGLGFSSKYMMLLFPLSLLPVIVFDRELFARAQRHLPLVLLGMAAGSAPVWLWNLQNDFISFKFQMEHGLGRKIWKPSWTLHYLLAQAALIFPVVLYWAVKGRKNLPKIFSVLAWLPLIFFLCTTYRGYVEANWPVMAYPAIFALAASAIPRARVGLNITIVTWAVFLSALFTVVMSDPIWAKNIKFREFHQFDEVAVTLQAQPPQPLFARSYQMAAKLHFLLRRPVYKLRGMNRRDFYDYLAGSEPGRGIYFLIVEKGDRLPPGYVARGHHVVDAVPVGDRFEIWRVEAP